MPVELSRIKDPGLRRTVSGFKRGGVTYNDVKRLIKASYDYKKVSKTEVADLTYFLHNAILDQNSKELLRTFLEDPKIRRLEAIENLTAAEDAVRFVHISMTIGASNKAGSTAEARACVARIRRLGYSSIKEMADRALAAGCGNCGEQAAIAFMKLAKRGFRPLDYMAWKRPGDHAFVVIGRKWWFTAEDPRKWGPKAVVSDPWARDWFYGSMYNVRMRALGGSYTIPESIFHLE